MNILCEIQVLDTVFLNNQLEIPFQFARLYQKNMNIHRDNDLPAVEYADGSKEWLVNGVNHRNNDLPAVESACGTKAWYKNGKLHREGGLPAIEWASGEREWYTDGIRIR